MQTPGGRGERYVYTMLVSESIFLKSAKDAMTHNEAKNNPCCQKCCFYVAFFSSSGGVPHIIYDLDYNDLYLAKAFHWKRVFSLL